VVLLLAKPHSGTCNPVMEWSASTMIDATFRSFGREVATYVQASAKSSHGRLHTILQLPAALLGQLLVV
jgi:hypothetical protein